MNPDWIAFNETSFTVCVATETSAPIDYAQTKEWSLKEFPNNLREDYDPPQKPAHLAFTFNEKTWIYPVEVSGGYTKRLMDLLASKGITLELTTGYAWH